MLRVLRVVDERLRSLAEPRDGNGRELELEPVSFAYFVGLVEVLVGLGEVDDSFNEADESDGQARYNQKPAQGPAQEHDYAGSGVSQVELVDSEPSQEDAEETGSYFALLSPDHPNSRACQPVHG